MNSNRKIDGELLWLKCDVCSAEYPTCVFSVETDMATSGLRARTNLESRKLFIYEEPNPMVSGREVELLRVEQTKSLPGESFQDYHTRVRNSTPRCYYKCISCSNGTASVLRRLSEEELSDKGFSLIRL